MAGSDIDNQSPLFENIDPLALDASLRAALTREGAGGAEPRLHDFAMWCGSAEALELARLANDNPPRLRTHDAKGRRLDHVDYHPAYHALMTRSVATGMHAPIGHGAPVTWGRLAHVERCAALYLLAGLEAGHCCPLTMTHAAAPVLAAGGALGAEWLSRTAGRAYDPRAVPPQTKSSVLIGMGMTERQGGTDVRANTTRATPTPDETQAFQLQGHKWFLSAPMSDAFVMLAQTASGPTCFLVPRVRPDGSLNALTFQRLKDKLGNRSNASAEVELHGALGYRIGDDGRGVATILEMVTATRLDCAVASAGLMRAALAEAIHHARHRRVFGTLLSETPLMSHVLADLALDVEAATALAFRLARAFDRATDPRASAWRRLMTPVTKYWVCKIAPGVVAEAMECLGGNGYIEESRLPRIYREVPVNSIWEGSGNVMALDVLRVLQREPEVADLVLSEIAEAISGSPPLTTLLERTRALLHDPRYLDQRARALCELLAVLAAGAILSADAPAPVLAAFLRTRIMGQPRMTYGQGLEPVEVKAILARALPM